MYNLFLFAPQVSLTEHADQLLQEDIIISRNTIDLLLCLFVVLPKQYKLARHILFGAKVVRPTERMLWCCQQQCVGWIPGHDTFVPKQCT